MHQTLTISPIVPTHGKLRYLWPVQSWRQFKSTTVAYALGMSGVAIAVSILDPAAPLLGVLLGAALGGSWALFANLPAQLTLITRGEARHFVDALTPHLTAIGYTSGVRTGPGLLHFVGSLPRWMRWDESELTMASFDHSLQLTGPKVALHLLKRRLQRDPDLCASQT